MSDEQIVYISPEDDLTSIRERLGHVTSKKVTMVVPNHSQLRSHVAWKLLYARARDLGKDVLIVSSDAQIRSVALAVNFKIATSLEAAASGKSKQTSRPGRPAAGRTRSSSLSTRPAAKGAEARSGTLRSRHSSLSADSWSQQSPPALQQQSPESRLSSVDDDDAALTGEPTSMPGGQYSSIYDFHVDTTPPIQPLSPEHMDEEPDLLLEDFNRARDIRQAALGSRPGAAPLPSEKKVARPSRSADDPFSFMDDSQPPPPMREQRGSVPREPFATSGHDIQDVPDIPTEILERGVEHRGASSNLGPRSHSWVEPAPEDEQDIVGPSRSFDVRPHRLSSPGKPPASSSRRDLHEARELLGGGEDDLPPIEDRPTNMTPQVPAANVRRPSHDLAGTSRRSQPLAPQGRTSKSLAPQGRTSKSLAPQGRTSKSLAPQGRTSKSLAPQGRTSRPLEGVRISQPAMPREQRPSQVAQPAQQHRQRSVASRVGPAPSRASANSRASRKPVASRGNLRSIVTLVIIIVIVVIVASVAYFGPSSEILLTLQTKPYTHDLTLVAQDGNGLPAQLQAKTFNKNGMLIATGSKKVGKAAATGSVIFKNGGQQPAHVPSNTIITTSNDIQFKTYAEISVNPPGKVGNAVQVPVTAVQTGENGNVPAGVITVIPANSLEKIASASNATSADLRLTVTNDDATSGGGIGTTHVVQKSDLDNARQDLHNQLQKDIDAWVNQWSIAGVHGNPSATDTLVNGPQEGQTVDDPNVPVVLNVSVSLLYVSNDSLQKAAVAQLNDSMRKDTAFNGERVLEEAGKAPVHLEQSKAPTGDAKSMTLTFKASTLAIPNLGADDVRHQVAGLSIDNAVEELLKLPGVQHVDIKPWPGFIQWVPTWSAHISVKFVPGAPPGPPKK